MFTGLIEEVGQITRVTPAGAGLDVTVDAPETGPHLEGGGSVAVNGICLTIEELSGNTPKFHLGTETVERTTASQWRRGELVNLERALATGQRMGGHFVQGHVDCTAQLLKQTPPAETVYFTFSLPTEFRPFVAEKGSITVDGISLTVTEISEAGFSVALIPYTLAHTNLSELSVGAGVNIEVDIIAKYVYNMLHEANAGSKPGITKDFLSEHGFC